MTRLLRLRIKHGLNGYDVASLLNIDRMKLYYAEHDFIDPRRYYRELKKILKVYNKTLWRR